MFKLSQLVSIFGIAMLLTVRPAAPQSLPPPPTPDQNLGVNISQSYHGQNEDVNLATGNVHIQIELVNLPGRNGHDLHIPLDYNSQVWRMFPDVQTVVNSLNQVGTETFWHWTRGAEQALPMPAGWYGLGSLPTVVHDTYVQVDQNVDGSGHPVHQFCDTNYRLVMPDGGVHRFPGIKTNCSSDGIYPWIYTNLLVGDTDYRDTLWMRYDVNNGLFGSNGERVAGLTSEDTNGNLISSSSTNQTPISYTDSVGRTVQLTYTSGLNSPTGVVYKDSSGSTQTITLNYLPNGSFTTTGSFSNPAPVASTNQPNTYAMAAMTCSTSTPCSWGPMLSSIVLPSVLTYTFHYNSTFGELDQITYPTGGYTRYEYATFQRGIRSDMNGPETPMGPWDFREIVAKHVCRASVVPRGAMTYTLPGAVPTNTCPVAEDTTTYSPTISVNSVNNASLSVTDPLGNLTVFQFLTEDPYETQRKIYDNGGHLLRTVDTTYTGNGFFRASETVTLANGLVTKTEFDYQTAQRLYSQPWPPGVAQVPLTVTDATGNVTEKREFAYGQPSAGALLRKSDTAWGYVTPGAPFNNRKTSDIVYDGSSNIVAQNTYEYDNYTQPLVASGATQHDSAFGTSYGTRGNLTAIKRWRNSDAVWLTTRNQYDDAGNIVSTTDPLGLTTSFDYTDSWGNSGCSPASGNAAASITKVTNALGQITKNTYNSCSGTVASNTDRNNQTTNFSYDLMNRHTQTLLPADAGGHRGETDIAYNDSALPVNVVTTKKITSSISAVATDILDGLARVQQHKVSVPTTTCPGGYTFQDFTFDALGRSSTTSNPYCTTSDPTYGVTTTQYDALGRVTQATKQDGSVSSVSYSGNCTTATDEAGRPRKSCTDALGRLIEVDEPGNGTAGAQASGSLTITGAIQSGTVSPHPASSGRGEVSVGGTLLSNSSCTPSGQPCTDSGTVSITVNGFTKSVSYGSGSTSAGIAQALISAFHLDTSSPVDATSLGVDESGYSVIRLTARTTGSATNYPLSSAVVSNNPANFPSPSFQTIAGTALTGGQDLSTTSGTVYDSGTVYVNFQGGFGASAPYSQSGNSTAAQIAAALGGAGPTGLNRPSSPVTVSVSGATINFIFKTPGTVGNLAVTTTSSTQFPDNPSFPSQYTTLSGGVDPQLGTLSNPYVTLFQYDTLNNLLCVHQKGTDTAADKTCNDATVPAAWRPRVFTYDSLSRLLTANNPESGAFSYSYDADGNLLQKTSPAPNQTGSAVQTLSYCYDALNRVTGKAYSAQTCSYDTQKNGRLPAGTAVVSYTYDSGTNGVGHLTGVTDQAGSATYAYDVLGRLSSETRVIAGISKTMGYTYNLDSSPATVTYPSGAIVTYTPDSAGRTLSAVDSGNNYITSATYGPDSALTGFISGNSSSFAGITNSFSYNNRFQPCRMTASTGAMPSSCADTNTTHVGNIYDLTYDFHLGNGTSGSDNGNVWGITNNKDTTRSQTFTYDAANRLTSAQNVGTDCLQPTLNSKTKFWGNSYAYDAWGNLLGKTVTKCSAENLSLVSNSQNRADNGSGQNPQNYQYDAAGNMTHDLSNGGVNYNYDPENRLTGAAGFIYTYDADGNRVEKSNGATPPTGTLYWYMTPGIVGESDLAGTLKTEYVFFDGERVARKDFPAGTVSYYFSDHLKTASVVTNAAGTILDESDYYPWGGELQFVNNLDNHYKFTGKERDAESGLDLMGVRYYGSALGRFTSPDPEFASPDRVADPQQWNMYAYARNNPLSITDPTGLDFYLTCSGGNTATCHNGIQGQTTTDANGKSTFTATDIDMNDSKDASAGYHDQFGNQYTGSFDENNGVSFTNTATGATSSHSRFIEGSDETDVNGSTTGAFSGIQGRFNSNCGGSCEAKGSLYDLPGHPNAVSDLEKKIGKSLEDNLNLFGGHGKSISFRFGKDQLTHILNHRDGPDKGKQEVHFEGHAPGRDLANFVLHQADAIKDSANHRSAQEPRLP